MKITVIALALLLSATSFAFPTIGDTATYDVMTVDEDGTAARYMMTSVVKSFDLPSDQYVITQYTQMEDGTAMGQQDETQKISEVLNMMNSVANCTVIGSQAGVNAQIVTVSVAGVSHQACKLLSTDSSTEVVMGNVPFGLFSVKMVADSAKMQITLKNFSIK